MNFQLTRTAFRFTREFELPGFNAVPAKYDKNSLTETVSDRFKMTWPVERKEGL